MQTIPERITEYLDNLAEELDHTSPLLDVLDRINEVCDDLWCELVGMEINAGFDIRAMVNTAQSCLNILNTADQFDCLDERLYTGNENHRVFALVAQNSLRKLVFKMFKLRGHDIFAEYPLA